MQCKVLLVLVPVDNLAHRTLSCGLDLAAPFLQAAPESSTPHVWQQLQDRLQRSADGDAVVQPSSSSTCAHHHVACVHVTGVEGCGVCPGRRGMRGHQRGVFTATEAVRLAGFFCAGLVLRVASTAQSTCNRHQVMHAVK